MYEVNKTESELKMAYQVVFPSGQDFYKILQQMFSETHLNVQICWRLMRSWQILDLQNWHAVSEVSRLHSLDAWNFFVMW